MLLDQQSQVKKQKKLELMVYIKENFELTMEHFLPIFHIFSKGNPIFYSIFKYLDSPEFNEIFSHTFPIKIEIPIAYAVKCNLSFKDFK